MSAQQAKFVSAWFDEASHTPDHRRQGAAGGIVRRGDGPRQDRRVGNQGPGAAAGGPDGRNRAAVGRRLHAKLTDLLCELTVYNFMQAMHSMHQVRPRPCSAASAIAGS